MKELYKPINGYETLYEVSNLGNVKSLPKGDGNGNKERILTPEVIVRNHTNYHRVSLSKCGVVTRIFIHRLVAAAFISNPDNKPHVNHISNNGVVNVPTNLEWCTHSENMKHSANQKRTGLPSAWDANRTKTIKGFKEKYKDNFISLNFEQEQGKPRSYITYRCKVCSSSTTKRSDSSLASLIVCSRKCKTKSKGDDDATH